MKVWDAENFELAEELKVLSQRNWAATRPGKLEPTAMSDGAGEFLMWIGRDPVSKRLKAYPYEALASRD